MRTTDARTLLGSFELPPGKFASEVGERNGAAYLKMSYEPDSGDFAVVNTPGDRWFALEVRGGLSYDLFEEGSTDDEVSAILHRLFEGALAYMEGRRTISLSRMLKIPSLRVETGSGPLDLHLSMVGAAKRILRIA